MVAGQSCIAGPSGCSTVLPLCRPCSYHPLLHNVFNNTGTDSPCLLQGSAHVGRPGSVIAHLKREERLSRGLPQSPHAWHTT